MISVICVVCVLIALLIFSAVLILCLAQLGDEPLRIEITELLRDKWIFILLAVMAGVVLSALYGYLLATTIVKRIDLIVDHVNRLTSGDYSSRADSSSLRTGELGELAKATNDLGARLETFREEAYNEKSKSDILLERMVSGVLVANVSGRTILANPAAAEILGIPEETLAGAMPIDTIFKGIPEMAFARLKETCGGGGGHAVFEREGKIIETRYTTFREGEGYPFRLVLLFSDITGERALQLKQSDFVANVSHELKTPLTIVKTYTETLLSGNITDERVQHEMLERVELEADRMNDIVRDLLQLSRLENNSDVLHNKRLKLKTLADSAIMLTKDRAMERGIDLRLEFNADPELVIKGEKIKLEQALINVISNAINYTNKGGKVTLSVGAEGNDVFFKIADTGIGISQEDLPRVFERFFRVDKARSRAAGGTGLGLAIAKGYVEAHGGTINIESTVGVGTTINIVLPIVVHADEEIGAVDG